MSANIHPSEITGTIHIDRICTSSSAHFCRTSTMNWITWIQPDSVKISWSWSKWCWLVDRMTVSSHRGSPGERHFFFIAPKIIRWTLNLKILCSHFGFYNEDEVVVPMVERRIYINDDIGLKTLDQTGRLKVLTFPHVHHFAWHMNISVIQEAILPYLNWMKSQLVNSCDETTCYPSEAERCQITILHFTKYNWDRTKRDCTKRTKSIVLFFCLQWYIAA